MNKEIGDIQIQKNRYTLVEVKFVWEEMCSASGIFMLML